MFAWATRISESIKDSQRRGSNSTTSFRKKGMESDFWLIHECIVCRSILDPTHCTVFNIKSRHPLGWPCTPASTPTILSGRRLWAPEHFTSMCYLSIIVIEWILPWFLLRHILRRHRKIEEFCDLHITVILIEWALGFFYL